MVFTPRLIWLRLYRVGIIAAIAWLIHTQGQWFAAREKSLVSLGAAQAFFPAAARVELRDPERGLHYAVDADDSTLGVLLTTSPETDDVIGYSGPNNLLIAIDTNGAVAGVQLLSSGDTPEHLDLVKQHQNFLQRFVGWKPVVHPAPRIEAVSGATLTSYAMAEAIQKRLAGTAPSLRFPEPVTLEEVRTLFTSAAGFRHDGRLLRVTNSVGSLLGFIARTSPEADNVSGYRGPSEALVAVAPDQRRITAVRLRHSYDTASYAEQIREDETYLKLFEGKTIAEIAALDYRREKIEGVSGATVTSYALAEGLKRRFATDMRSHASKSRWIPKGRDWALAGIVAGACVIAFTSLRGKRWVRITWQAVLVGYVGLVSGDLLSVALLAGWAESGLAWRVAPGLVLMAAAALIVPVLSRRQLYCHHICPHGAVQQWLGLFNPRRTRRKHAAGANWPLTQNRRPGLRAMEAFPFLLLAFAVMAMLLNWPVDLSQIEPFDAWIWQAATVVTVSILVIGFVAAIFIPQAYCRFGCPTGALLNFVRSSGSADRWGVRDWTAGALLFVSAVAVFATRTTPESDPMVAFTGRTMGTTWSVKIRQSVPNLRALQADIQAEFDRIEGMTSHWRSNTPVGQFNAAHTTEPVQVPAELVTLLRLSAEISRQTGGAFDVTILPVMRGWGFGPGARRKNRPDNDEVAEALTAVGWTNLLLANNSIRKERASTEIDLSSIVPGYAVDQVTRLLASRSLTNVLVESGGELRAGGVWRTAIEYPARSCVLSNEAIGTSGTYRQNWKAGNETFSHLIDPRTGGPVSHNTVSVSVRLPDCARADAWAAALNVLGLTEGLPLAEKLGLSAQFVVATNGELIVHETPAWSK